MEIKLEKLLSDDWARVIGDTVQAQPAVHEYLSEGRPWMIPKLDRTFYALKSLKPQDVKVVVFGQDPYPRAESANGIAFCDAAIMQWSDPLNPSFRNIIKNLLVSKKLLTIEDAVVAMRRKLKEVEFVDPPDWFEATMKRGVLWLNTSLTFSSTESSDLQRHTKFWRPIIEAIVRAILWERSVSEDWDKGIVFVLWGGYAKKLKPMILKQAKSLRNNVPIEFVMTKHPAVEAFHELNTFDLLDEALEKANAGKFDFLITKEQKIIADTSVSQIQIPEEDRHEVKSRKRKRKKGTQGSLDGFLKRG